MEGKATLDLIVRVYGSSLLLILLQRLSGQTKRTVKFKGLEVLQFLGTFLADTLKRKKEVFVSKIMQTPLSMRPLGHQYLCSSLILCSRKINELIWKVSTEFLSVGVQKAAGGRLWL